MSNLTISQPPLASQAGEAGSLVRPPEVSPELPSVATGLASRRHFLRTALVVSGGLLLASPAEALAFFFRSREAEFHGTPQTDIPEEWIRVLGPEVRKYTAFLERLRLRHIKVEQIIEPHLKRRGKVQNTLPPKKLWRQMRATLQATDRLAEKLGEPVRHVVSAYRSPEYNRACGAARDSYHMRNMALDLQFRSSPRTVALAARELREQGVFQGGVGRYSNFTHVDTRGRKADW